MTTSGAALVQLLADMYRANGEARFLELVRELDPKERSVPLARRPKRLTLEVEYERTG